MRIPIPLAGLLFAFAAPAAATDFFVSPLGDDAGSGLAGSPFRTLTKALSVAVDGDTVTVASGDYDVPGGESFPLLIPDGVSIVGDPNVAPLIDAQTSGEPAFLAVGITESTLVQSLQIVGSAGTTAVAIGAPVTGLEFSGCSFFCTNGSSIASADAASSTARQSAPPNAPSRCGDAEPRVSAPISAPTSSPMSPLAQLAAIFMPTG